MRRLCLLLLGFTGSVLAFCLLLCNAFLTPSAEAESTSLMPIKLPYRIPGTQLVVKQLASYDGPFLEDGSDREVTDVAALVLFNQGPSGIKESRVELSWTEGKYCFEAFMIPAGESVLVLEKNEQKFMLNSWTQCSGYQRLLYGDWSSFDKVTVMETTMGLLMLENTSRVCLNDICVTYKSYLAPPGVYVGGISYSVVVPKLMPGESVTIPAWHYAGGNSRIVYIGCQTGKDSH